MSKTPSSQNFYNYDKINSYNGLFNFIISMRGLGKTYGGKEGVIKKALTRGEHFVFVRRYKDELKMSSEAFWADIIVEEAFPDWDFRTFGSKAQAAPASTRDDKKRSWDTIGHFIPLSIQQSVKGVSYPLVTTIIFDEFIIEKGNIPYLQNEVTKFLNLYSTIARKRTNVKVFFLANSASIMNPYFLHWKIRPNDLPEFSRHNDGLIVVHLVKSKAFEAEVLATPFGRLIQGTDYADYAVSSEFADDHDNLLGSKTPEAKYYMSLETAHGTFSVWIDYRAGKTYIQEKRPKREMLMTLLPETMSEEKTLLTFNDKILSNLRTQFRHGRLISDSAQTRNAFIEVFKR